MRHTAQGGLLCTHLGHNNDFDIRISLLQQIMSNMEAGERAPQDYDRLSHVGLGSTRRGRVV